MTRSLVAGFLASAALLASLPAASVRLDANGLGQALIYPYYTARATQEGNAWNTLISLVNTRAKAKVVKVRFREALHARIVWEANVYLGPNDMWTGAVVRGADGAAHVVSADISCIDPAHSGTDAGTFSTASFAGSAADGAGTGVDRTLEGFAEVIEMGTLAGASADAVTDNAGGAPNNCKGVTGPGLTRNITAPEGGLSGTALLLNINTGLAVPYAPVALADLTRDPFYSDVGAAGTDYDSPQVTPISVIVLPAGTAFGSSPSGYLLRSSWSRGVDAVSAVLMTASIHNEFVLDAATASNTDWVVTMPTARFYTDGTAPTAPFDAAFAASGACEVVTWVSYSREQWGFDPSNGSTVTLLPPPPPPSGLCWASNVVSPRNGSANAYSTPVAPTLLLGSLAVLSSVGVYVPTPFQDGFLAVDIAPAAPGLASASSSTAIDLATGDVISGAHLFKGLPVVGFAAWKFDNGLLSCNGQTCKGSFGATYPHHFIQSVSRIAP